MARPIRNRTSCAARRATWRLLLQSALALLAFPFAAGGQELGLLPELPHTNLLVYRTTRGGILPVRTKTDWRRRRAEILHGMQAIMGPVPGRQKRCPLDVRIEGETDE